MRKVFIYLFFILCISNEAHGLFPLGRVILKDGENASWNADSDGISYRNQYSLKWDEQTCRTRWGHDIGYVTTPSMNPTNSDGFFNPGINTIHGFIWWDIWNGLSCQTHHGGATFTAVTPNMNRAFCRSLGLWDAERVCFTTKKAPSSKRELYQWLAEIDYAVGGKDSQNDPILNKVRNWDANALNIGYRDFQYIKMKWVRDIGLDTDPEVLKKYISPFPGQKMICARARGAATSASNPACSEPDKCLSLDSLHLIIKCLPVPMGPPPNPFTGFIVGKEVIYSVPVRGMDYANPSARIVYFERNIKKIAIKDNLNSGSIEFDSGSYKFRVNVDESSICSFVVDSKDANIAYPVGCQDRGVAPKPTIESNSPITVSNKPQRKVSGRVSYPWHDFPPLRPTDLSELKDITKLEIDKEIHSDEKYGAITVFQGGFNRNPQRKKINLEYLSEKMCYVKDGSATGVVEYIDVNNDCREIPSMIKRRNIELFRCKKVDEEMFVENKDDCKLIDFEYDGGATQKGNQCHNGRFILSKNCDDISSNVVYEHDDSGQKICMRSWRGGERRYTIVRRDKNNPSNITKIKIVEANNVLMYLDSNGEVDFSKNPESFNNFSQDDLDYFRRIDESHYWYKNANRGIDIKYRYGPKLFKSNDPMNLSDATTSYLNVDTSQPIFLNQDDELLEPDPLDAGLCSDINLPATGEKKWEYILQIPGYYTNYNQQAFNNDSELKNSEANLIKAPGMITVSANTTQDLSKFDGVKKSTLLIPTKFVSGAQGVDEAILGIANDANNRNIKFSSFNQNVTNNFNFKSFNFYPDYFESRKSGKILYSDGKDLTKNISANNPQENLFDTSSCNLIEFEIWGGGGQSRSNAMVLNSDSVVINASNSALQNNASAGQNGAYAQGRFKIRENSFLKMKVSDGSGNITNGPNNTADKFNLSDDFSSISVTDTIDTNLQLIRAYSGSGKHECEINSQCSSLKEEPNIEKAINNNEQLIFKDDNSKASFVRNALIKPLERGGSIDKRDIAIDSYRNITMSSFSGIVNDLFRTLPLSSPVVINMYIDDENDQVNGYKIEDSLVKFTTNTASSDWKDNGTGDFNEIGTYYYLGQLTNLGNNFKFMNRSRYFDPEICKSKLESCYSGSTLVTDKNPRFIYGGNSSSAVGVSDNDYLRNFVLGSTLTQAQKDALVTDFNLYCPGLGGCYFHNGKSDTTGRFVSQPGSAGLIKIRCKRI